MKYRMESKVIGKDYSIAEGLLHKKGYLAVEREVTPNMVQTCRYVYVDGFTVLLVNGREAKKFAKDFGVTIHES